MNPRCLTQKYSGKFFLVFLGESEPGKEMKKMVIAVNKNVGLLLLVLLLCSCSVVGPKKPVPLAIQGMPDAPAPSLASASPTYAIHAGDELEIKFFYNKDLNETVTVRPDGRISLQLVQEVQAASLSTGELASILENRYASFLKDPEISVIVRAFDSRRIYIDGEVERPGMINMGGSMTIMQAIASVGGLQNSARAEEVLVVRRNSLKKPFVLKIDLKAAMDGTDLTQNIALQSYDIIYVSKSAIANVNTFVDLYIRKNIPIGLGYGFYNTVD